MTRLSRDDIIAGAGRRFASHGYHGTSMRDLGDDLGILGSSIYAHVGGKQELLVAVIERGATFFEQTAQMAVEEGVDPVDRLRRLIEGHIGVVLDHRAEARTYLSQTDFLDPAEAHRVSEMRDGYEAIFVETIRAGMESGAFRGHQNGRLSTIYVLSILNSIDRWFSPRGSVDRNELVEDVFGFVMAGLGQGER